MSNFHPLSDVQSENIGEGTRVWQFCVVLRNAIIGKNCNINCNVFVENDVKIGNNVTIKSGVQIWDGVEIEDSVFIGPNATFTNDLSPRSKHYPENFDRTLVKSGASIGANATILAGLIIGNYSLIGAGSVLTKSTQNYSLWVGNPARHIGYVSKKGIRINLELKDKTGNQYKLTDEGEPELII